MFIDPHVHCRDGTQSYKETIAHALSVAERAGMSAIFDMPNTDPPIFRFEQAAERIALARQTKSPVWYGLYVGLSADKEQIVDAVRAYDELPEVVGCKMFAGHSTGNLGVTDEKSQQFVYDTLAELGYTGVVAVHCEKESLMKPLLWNPLQPVSHCVVRPPQAEVASVRDQLSFARIADFNGTVHVAHISVPEAVDIVESYRKKMSVTCGVTPYHCLLDSSALEKKGLICKTNPPLHIKPMVDQMMDYLCSGAIDWIESDHAPHLLREKLHEPHLSGMPGMPCYPRFIQQIAPRMSTHLLHDVTFGNIQKKFGIDIPQRHCEPQTDLAREYEFDGFG